MSRPPPLDGLIKFRCYKTLQARVERLAEEAVKHVKVKPRSPSDAWLRAAMEEYVDKEELRLRLPRITKAEVARYTSKKK